MTDVDVEALLKRTEVSKPWNRDSLEYPPDHYRESSERLLDAFDETDDARFLNCALKLNEMLRERGSDAVAELTRREEDALQSLREEKGV